MSKETPAARLASLNERAQKTRDQEIRIKAMKEGNDQELKDARAEAKKNYKTDNLDELRALYTETQQKDIKALDEYESAITLRESILDGITDSLDKLRAN